MTITQWSSFFIWCTVINYGVLMVWFGAIVMFKDKIHHLHAKWFKLTEEQFDMVHYIGIAIYKVLVLVFCLVPAIALRLIK
jgi:hypothetical protein